MRFFIALEIPENSQKQLEVVQQQLQQVIPGVRLTDSNKLHLTIAFIGEQPPRLREKITEIIREAVRGIPPFAITPAYIDGFPNLHHAHILWIGAKGDIDKLMIIRERIKDGLEKLGLDPDERRFIPHIAIAKTNKDFHLQPEKETVFQEMMMDNFDPIQITSIKLFQSIPEDGFHKHNTLAEIQLEKEGQDYQLPALS
ncbi:MAG: RNA 2',3'-cyclic phosphodiesterase [Patescibacteria group bacterium]|nr:RNA 2',3'-cyclic phosphodiesterase [Patescibacteria group bacterium]